MQRSCAFVVRFFKAIYWPIAKLIEWRRNRRLLKNLQRANFNMQLERMKFRKRAFDWIYRKNKIVSKPLYHSSHILEKKFKEEAEKLQIRKLGIDKEGKLIAK